MRTTCPVCLALVELDPGDRMVVHDVEPVRYLNHTGITRPTYCAASRETVGQAHDRLWRNLKTFLAEGR